MTLKCLTLVQSWGFSGLKISLFGLTKFVHFSTRATLMLFLSKFGRKICVLKSPASFQGKELQPTRFKVMCFCSRLMSSRPNFGNRAEGQRRKRCRLFLTVSFFPGACVSETRTATGRDQFACQDSCVSQIFILIISNGEKKLRNEMWLCEDKLKGKTAHFRCT